MSMIVIKYGGNAMADKDLQKQFAQDIVALQQQGKQPVIVHGGGPQISAALRQAGYPSQFINGERVTDAATLEIVEMVLSGQVNKSIVQLIQQQNALAVGISGQDAKLMLAEADPDKKHLGQVGRVIQVNTALLHTLVEKQFIPVISPISTSVDGVSYNVNADFAAGAIAGALQADMFVLLSNIPGVLDADGQLISHLDKMQIEDLIAKGIISTGMVPKIRCALTALEKGVAKVRIMDGRVANILQNVLLHQKMMGTSIEKID